MKMILESAILFFSVILQVSGAAKSWNRIYPQPQPRAPCLSAVRIYIQQTFSHAFLPQKGKYAPRFPFGLLSLFLHISLITLIVP